MTSFYSTLTSQPKLTQAAALQTAIKELRAADGGKWDHPVYWANFSVVGGATGI